MTWQTIETAPKDSSVRVLLCYETKIGCRVVIGYWNLEQYAKTPKPFWDGEMAVLWGKEAARKSLPTHWMPLPSPPTTEGE